MGLRLNPHDIIPESLAVQAMRDNGYKNAAYAIAILRDKLQHSLQTQIPNLVVNGDLNNRLSGNLHISIPGIPNSAIIARVRTLLAISTGASCSSGTMAPSHVLQAMNLSENITQGALRIGIGKFTTKQEIDKASSKLINAFNKIDQLI